MARISAESIKSQIRQLFRPYYLINIILSLSFVTLKNLKPVCYFVFPTSEEPCELDMRESEILFFLLFIVMIRARKTGSTNMISYLTSGFMYAKVANLALWFYNDPRLGLLYGTVFILQAMLLPEPSYTGPENITYFRANTLDEELERDKRITWLVAFYTVWSPSCVNFASIYSKLSAEYGLENLKFGKIDVGRYPEVAKKYYVDDSSYSRQLPSVILFKDGKEAGRRPFVDSKGKIQKFIFNEENVVAAFDLNNLYTEKKNNPLKKKKEKESNHTKVE